MKSDHYSRVRVIVKTFDQDIIQSIFVLLLWLYVFIAIPGHGIAGQKNRSNTMANPATASTSLSPQVFAWYEYQTTGALV